jgi:signal transduction histidine kinase
MGIMNRLLNKTFLYYTFFATLLLVLSAPIFYWTIEHLYYKDIDEALSLRKAEFQKKNLPYIKTNEIPLWNNFNRDIRILPDTFTGTKDIVQQTFFTDSSENELEPYRVLYTNISIDHKSYLLMIRLNLVDSEDLMETLTWMYLAILFTLFVVLFVFTRFVSNRLWQPFYETLQKIESFNIERHTLPDFTSTSIREFKQLNMGLTKLIEENIRAFKSQKEFTENASHELQTPLAVFQTKLDLLLQQPSLSEEQGKIIHSLYEAAARLVRVNKNLLLLAKIENTQYSEKETIDISNIIREVVPYFSEQAESKNIKIQTEIPPVPVSINANKGLVEIMINNLLLNAIRHNHTDGTISIIVSNDSLLISNSGANHSLNANTLFKRFSKSSEDAHSSGLGLAIIKQICQLHQWQINYEFKNSFHLFSIVF